MSFIISGGFELNRLYLHVSLTGSTVDSDVSSRYSSTAQSVLRQSIDFRRRSNSLSPIRRVALPRDSCHSGRIVLSVTATAAAAAAAANEQTKVAIGRRRSTSTDFESEW